MLLKKSLLLLAAIGIAACENAGKDIVSPVEFNGAVNIRFYIDNNGNGLDGEDPLVSGIKIYAFAGPSGTDTLRRGTSNAEGIARLTDLPLGTYHIKVDLGTVGDTLEFISIDTTRLVRLLARLDQIGDSRDFGLSYPQKTIAQARAMAPGRKVIIKGKVLSPLQAFHDSMAFVSDSSGTIRITDSKHVPGRLLNELGDSVSVIGVTGTHLGKPVLTKGVFTTIIAASPVPPRIVTVAEARTAKGGTIDAALVQILGGKVVEAAFVSPYFRVLVSDPTNANDQVEVLVDPLITVPQASFTVGRVINVVGVLIPKGDGTWVVRPRSATDVVLP